MDNGNSKGAVAGGRGGWGWEHRFGVSKKKLSIFLLLLVISRPGSVRWLVMRQAISFLVSDSSLFTGVLAAFIVVLWMFLGGYNPIKAVHGCCKTSLPYKQPAAVCSQSIYYCEPSKWRCLKTLSRKFAFLCQSHALLYVMQLEVTIAQGGRRMGAHLAAWCPTKFTLWLVDEGQVAWRKSGTLWHPESCKIWCNFSYTWGRGHVQGRIFILWSNCVPKPNWFPLGHEINFHQHKLDTFVS